VDAGKRTTLRAILSSLDPSGPVRDAVAEVEKPRVVPIPKPVTAPPQRGLPKSRIALVIVALVVLAAILGFLLAPSHKPQTPSSSTPIQSPAATAPAPQPEVASAPASTAGTTKGDVAERVSPEISESATRTIHGKVEVVVRVSVDANGAVSSASFDSEGHSRYFADHALSAARNWKFKPAQVNGAAAPSQWTLHFQFRRDGTEISAKEVSP
jgi:TonB family protein